MTSIYADADIVGEPTLDEILAEPIIQLIMKRDGVDERDMRGQIDRIQRVYDDIELAQ